MDNQRPLVSVIIPVYNDASRLRLCLRALHQQTYPSNLLEIIVVDNGSRDGSAGVCSEFPGTVLLEHLPQGSYGCRNRGIEIARGEILAFTDSDCVPDLDWVEVGVRRLSGSRNRGLVGGRVEVFARTRRPTNPVELHDLVLAFPQHHYIAQGFSGAGNLFTSRAVLNQVGWFVDSLKSCGDREWGQRVQSAGLELVYASDVVVRHPARTSLGQITAKARRIQRGMDDLMRLRGEKRPAFYCLLPFLYTWPSLGECRRNLRALDAERAHNLILLYAVVILFRCACSLECLRLQWGKREAT